MIKYDLHTHTIYSDGGLSPKELIKKAEESKLKYLAITNHNNIEGSKIACSLNKNIIVIPILEMKGKYQNGRLHILGYNIDFNNNNLNQILNTIKRKSYRYNKKGRWNTSVSPL